MEEGFARRLFLPDVRGPHRYLRVTWHPETSTIVLSHWEEDICLASTPVSLQDATQLVGMIVGALKDAAARPTEASSPPSVGRSHGLLGRLRERLRPQLAHVVALHVPLKQERSADRSGGA